MAVLKTEPSRRIGRTDSGNNGMQRTRARRIDLSLSNVLSLSAVSLSLSLSFSIFLSLSLFLSLFLSFFFCEISRSFWKSRIYSRKVNCHIQQRQISCDLTSPRVSTCNQAWALLFGQAFEKWLFKQTIPGVIREESQVISSNGVNLFANKFLE